MYNNIEKLTTQSIFQFRLNITKKIKEIMLDNGVSCPAMSYGTQLFSRNFSVYFQSLDLNTGSPPRRRFMYNS